MTSFMGQKRWTEAWQDGRRRRSVDYSTTGKAASEVSGGTDLSLERPVTRDASFLLREPSRNSLNPDCSNYQEKLQGWSAVFQDTAFIAQRPGTSINSTRPINMGLQPHNLHQDLEKEASFLTSHRNVAFPAKPRELVEPLEGIMPSSQLVSQRKYYVLPSIGHQHDLFLRRQRSNVETLNQLDYRRDNYEDDAEFFAELIELKRESSVANTPLPQRSPGPPLPPIKLRDVVRPRTNIAELDEDHFLLSGRDSTMSDISDVDEFRVVTPDPDYTNCSPRKLSNSTSPRKNSLRESMSSRKTDSDMVDVN